ncbi:NAD-dependent epimerase/dehydratase family protein [Pyxidicoccus fallax]|uniref:NAD-dependent epimerase/dehydratase family protein n=1 Tax=Pyxidicoccus fallax TaxID=394095 RepID=A0A848LUK2_9BACT|nr:NAD-dependent epimerase/dehydratase family protein [Pyxidicoccus fallax]NMO21024.1 NAD-dependent epimerase/dehydratase family protein [Pyxidicoccus fallax]NPC85412.1 NAD-dependent epimerase/dehydratase family protein [Pyxidicoccus fallax]
MRVLVTGAAGFIGHHVSARLLARGDAVIGVDNLDPAGDVALKQARLARLRHLPGAEAFTFHAVDITDREALRALFERERPRRVVHLAARVGVRAGANSANGYLDTNVTGFLQLLECARGVEHLVYASSSSVYGGGTPPPFREDAAADRPLNLYAATKRADELLAHVHGHLHGLPTSGLRFFTVYGPWGRPDMAPLRFLRALREGRPIDLYGEGRMRRDFTHVDDVAEAVLRVLDRPPTGTPPYRLLNVGRGEPVALRDFLAVLERHLGTPARLNLLPAQPGEMESTWADPSALERETGFRPRVSVEEGLARLVEWDAQHSGR